MPLHEYRIEAFNTWGNDRHFVRFYERVDRLFESGWMSLNSVGEKNPDGLVAGRAEESDSRGKKDFAKICFY